MYAIIKSGSKQYRVAEGDVIHVEILNAQEKNIDFTDILFSFDGKEHRLGAPSGFVVTGEILGETVGPKIRSAKYKKRKRQRKLIGHRQHYSKVKIMKIGKAK